MARRAKRGLKGGGGAPSATSEAQKTPRRATGPSRKRGPGPRTVLTLVALALAAVAVIYLPRFVPRRGPGGGDVARPFTSPTDVWQQAQEATNRGELLEAYEILVRGVAQFPGDADVANAFGVSVNNSSYFVRPVRGRAVPIMPTSLARVQAAQAALAAFDRASSGKPGLASPYHYRGNLYAAWGMPNDALRELYQARLRGDSTASLMRTASAIVAIQRGAMDETLPGGAAP